MKMGSPRVYCWGLKIPETKDEARAYIRELYGAKDDLEILGFTASVKLGKDKLVLISHRVFSIEKQTKRK